MQTEYFSEDGQKLPSAENAHHRREATFRDSVRATVREFYPGGQVRFITQYLHLKKKIRHGTSTSWYENGKIHTKEDFIAGKREGELLVYYPEGAVRRRDQFQAGKRTAGECFGPDGKAVEYFEYEQMPQYPGGQDALLRQIARSVRYPKEALRARVQGKVFVAFVVDQDGQATNIRVAKSLSPATDEEAVRVISQLSRFRPGQQDGKPVSVSYTVPISFAIR
ncbi:TonB family protein [Hymenobacter sp. BT175]|nr:TonB family protein [Hymenobacter translucens]